MEVDCISSSSSGDIPPVLPPPSPFQPERMRGRSVRTEPMQRDRKEAKEKQRKGMRGEERRDGRKARVGVGESAEVGSSCRGFPPTDVFPPPFFPLFFSPQHNRAGLIAYSWPIPTLHLYFERSGCCGPTEPCPDTVPRCQAAAADWHQPDTGGVKGTARWWWWWWCWVERLREGREKKGGGGDKSCRGNAEAI